MNNARNGIILALVLLLLATAFTGINTPLGYSSECTDGLDNDGDLNAIDGGIDVEDDSCFYYPYNDGNGESDTPINERYNSIRDYPSLFEYHRDYGGFVFVCDAYAQGLYDSNPLEKIDANTWLDGSGGLRINCPP